MATSQGCGLGNMLSCCWQIITCGFLARSSGTAYVVYLLCCDYPAKISDQKIAMIFAGLAMPPGKFSGWLVTKKVHRPNSLHFLESASR